ncbi:MAG: HU family DNA-binding protein [Planktotalea arctica]|uniref:HU family DNA-binding protein n=1 Tax=Planktotalea arctica TaxID=1481893 RepID=UPI0032192505
MVTDPALKKKELIDTVTERSGIKKKDAKPVIEAMLEVLGETLAEGREMNLQPLGKIKINRTKEVQGGNVLIVKVRQSSRVPGSGRAPDVDAAG